MDRLNLDRLNLVTLNNGQAKLTDRLTVNRLSGGQANWWTG